jgi:acyl-CoA hydrolase
VGEVVSLDARIVATFRTSMEIEVVVTGEDSRTGRTWPCVHALTVFVAIDDQGQPAPVPPLLIDSDELRASQAAALARRAARLTQR